MIKFIREKSAKSDLQKGIPAYCSLLENTLNSFLCYSINELPDDLKSKFSQSDLDKITSKVEDLSKELNEILDKIS